MRRALAALGGAVIGGLGTLSLVFLSAVEGPLLALPIVAGIVIGLTLGDRGLIFLAKVIDWL